MRDLSLPVDLAAERAVLGAILLEREAVIAVASQLAPEQFYLDKHARIYAACLALSQRRTPPDVATVASALRERGDLEAVGGIAFLGELMSETPTAVHVEYYGQAVVRAATQRRMIEAGGRITAIGYEAGDDLAAALGEAEESLFRVTQSQTQGRDFVTAAAAAGELLAWLDGEDAGLLTGFPDLDALLGGLQPGGLYILAGRPGMGKTALALNLLEQIAVRQRRRVAMFSLEMGRNELLRRLVAMRTGLNTQQIRPSKLPPERLGDLLDALGAISEASFSVDDTPSERIGLMRSKARRVHALAPLDLVIVDYLGLAEAKAENRVQQIGEISRNLKAMARELSVPVLALAQLNRGLESRASKVPQLSDLRDSGDVEQDADAVLFVHRPDYYDRTEQPGIAEIHVAKHRNGPLGVVALRFDAPTTRFLPLAPAWRSAAD